MSLSVAVLLTQLSLYQWALLSPLGAPWIIVNSSGRSWGPAQDLAQSRHSLNVWGRNEKQFKGVPELTPFGADTGTTLMRCTVQPRGLRSCAWGLGGGIYFPIPGGRGWKRLFSHGMLSLLKTHKCYPATWKRSGYSMQGKWIHQSSVIWLGNVSSCFSK